jgi:hypothetical protein
MRIHDTQCGFRAFSRDAARRLRVTGLFTYTQEAILDLAFRRMRIKELPINVRYYKERKSRVVKSIPRYTFKVLGNIAIVVVRHQFLRFILILLLATTILTLLSFLIPL